MKHLRNLTKRGRINIRLLERFKKLCARCPQHGLTEQTLLQYFYEGLLPLEMKMSVAASGGALINMTLTAVRNLISTMTANYQQFHPTNERTRRVNEIRIISLENKIDKFFGTVQSIIPGKICISRLCRICMKPDHPTDCCPMLREYDVAWVNVVGNFPRPPKGHATLTATPIIPDSEIIQTSTMDQLKHAFKNLTNR
ncbi:hypothetical protein GQ457_07G005580 [Hibiscus cannabinus]